MDAWAWAAIAPWVADRLQLPVGPLFCVIDGPTRGRAWSASAARVELRHLALKAGVRRRFAPHQLRHAHAVELLHEGAAADPAPTRPLAPVNHRHLPRRDQHRGNHLHHPRQASTDDARQRRTRPVAATRGSATALPHPGTRSRAKQQSQLNDAASPIQRC